MKNITGKNAASWNAEQWLEDFNEAKRVPYGTNNCRGCGAFNHPPREMAMQFKRVIEEREFCGAFREIHFAIFDDHNAARKGVSKVEAFKEVFG